MNATRIQEAVFIFIVGNLLACIGSGIWLSSSEVSIINSIASFNTLEFQTSGGWAVAKGLISFFDALVTIFLWDYPFLASPWALFIKIPLWIISIGTIIAIVEAAKSVIDGVVSSIRTIIGGTA